MEAVTAAITGIHSSAASDIDHDDCATEMSFGDEEGGSIKLKAYVPLAMSQGETPLPIDPSTCVTPRGSVVLH